MLRHLTLPRNTPRPTPWWRECHTLTNEPRHFWHEPPTVFTSGYAESVWVLAPVAEDEARIADVPKTLAKIPQSDRCLEETSESRDWRMDHVAIDDVHAGTRFNRKLAAFDARRFVRSDTTCVAWVRWGDGETNLGSILLRGNELWVCGAHEYSHPGEYEVRVTLSDGVIQAETKSVRVRVAAPVELPDGDPPRLCGLEAVAPVGRDARLALARVDSASSSWWRDWISVIEWGDGSSSGGQLLPSLRGGASIVGQHRYSSSGRFSTRITVADAYGRLAHATGIVWVAG